MPGDRTDVGELRRRAPGRRPGLVEEREREAEHLSMNYHETCPHCGNRITAYIVKLNEPLISAFVAFAGRRMELGRAVAKRELQLTHSQYGNFQKLRHFGLIAPAGKAWEMTPLGWDFYYGRKTILTPAAQFGNAPLADDHPAWKTHDGAREAISITDVLKEGWRDRASYKEEKRMTAPKTARTALAQLDLLSQ